MGGLYPLGDDQLLGRADERELAGPGLAAHDGSGEESGGRKWGQLKLEWENGVESRSLTHATMPNRGALRKALTA